MSLLIFPLIVPTRLWARR